jgi:uncharacterized delta-60 repeat protein
MKCCATACLLLILAAAAPATAAPGDLDPSFSGDGFDTQNVFNEDCGRDVAIAPDGKIVVVGSCEGGVPTTFSVMRYLPDGNPDQNFGVDGVVNVSFKPASANPVNERAFAVAVQPDGKIVVAGTAELGEDGTSVGGDNFAVARLLPADGALDPSFNANGAGANQDGRFVREFQAIDGVRDVALGADGSIFVGGTPNRNTDGDFGVMKLSAQGTLDTTYDGDGKAAVAVGGGNQLFAIAVQPDAKVVVAGYAGPTGVGFPNTAQRTIGLARFTTGGQPDPTFDDDGQHTLDFGAMGEEPHGLAIDGAGRMVVAGTLNNGGDIAVARLLAGNGATDLAFDGDGRAELDLGGADLGNDVTALANGRIAVAGSTSVGANPFNAVVVALGDDGARDAGFGNLAGQPGVAVHDFGSAGEDLDGIAVQPDGRLVAAGVAPGTARDFLTVRLLGFPPPPPPAGPGPGPGGPPPPGPPPPDGIAPLLDGLTATRSFRAASRGDAVLTGGRRAPIGGTVRYTASEPVTAIFKVERATTGRRVGRRCVKATRRNRARRKCTRYVRVRGSFTHQGAAGRNTFKFSGRVGGRKLAVGSYRLVAVAEDAADNKSATRRRNFRIVRR